MKLVFATNNLNKLAEIRMLVPFSIEILSLKDINCNEELPETSDNLEDNAAQKAFYIFDNFGYNCFADDTGLEIDVLDGCPGVYSARYAGEQCIAEDNIQKVLSEMKGEKNRDACFRTIISLVIDGKHFQFEGMVEGQIIPEKWGNNGFGYDPIFLPNGFDESFAQMSIQQKNEISHRGLAVKKLIAFLKKKI
ncbi:MAG: non-canonical purine NTP pyrophosphatase [Flavobacteriales bacterium]|nr:non-canonical purine NTP pyrophosphatase [Flavobacteriales bacterium]|tara:strand:- start:2896 stop:3474 length:579 start_codon:yes stop_codon:yes gene_type:complete